MRGCGSFARAADAATVTLRADNMQEPVMAKSHISNDRRSPDPAGVEAGSQSGPGGAGGEPKGAATQARRDPPSSQQAPSEQRRREHSSDTAQPGYRARQAGQSGVGMQEDDTSPLDGPQGDGNYIASDHGDLPLRNG